MKENSSSQGDRELFARIVEEDFMARELGVLEELELAVVVVPPELEAFRRARHANRIARLQKGIS